MNITRKLAIATAVLASSVSIANELTLNDFVPVVITSTPIAGESMVDPSTKEITVKFSTDMMTNKMWSVVQLTGANFPKVTGQVYFKDDGRTFVIPVKLEGNTVYALSINSSIKKGFKSVRGKAAQPYTISFKTS